MCIRYRSKLIEFKYWIIWVTISVFEGKRTCVRWSHLGSEWDRRHVESVWSRSWFAHQRISAAQTWTSSDIQVFKFEYRAGHVSQLFSLLHSPMPANWNKLFKEMFADFSQQVPQHKWRLFQVDKNLPTKPLQGPFRMFTDSGDLFIWLGMGNKDRDRNIGKVCIRLLKPKKNTVS